MVRFYYTYKIFYTTYDVTWYCNRAWLWLGVESHLGIICASAPALKYYFRKDLGSLQTNSSASQWGDGSTFQTVTARNLSTRNGMSGEDEEKNIGLLKDGIELSQKSTRGSNAGDKIDIVPQERHEEEIIDLATALRGPPKGKPNHQRQSSSQSKRNVRRSLPWLGGMESRQQSKR
jgi:hypothetical protein